jgi:signal transduction histidine kinase
LSKERNEMMGIVAHDLKNPLTTITLGLYIAQKAFEKEQANEGLQKLRLVEQTARRMRGIIDGLLQINELEDSFFNVNWESVDVVHVLQTVIEMNTLQATAKDITVSMYKPDILVSIESDERFLFEIFDNLLSNAIKFSYNGSRIWLELQFSKDEVKVIIRDEGQGMSKEDLELLFERFTILSSTPTAGESSHRLGLSIVKKIVDALQGTITCSSEKGKGTEFTVASRHENLVTTCRE